jgi:hypothetical protein
MLNPTLAFIPHLSHHVLGGAHRFFAPCSCLDGFFGSNRRMTDRKELADVDA